MIDMAIKQRKEDDAMEKAAKKAPTKKEMINLAATTQAKLQEMNLQARRGGYYESKDGKKYTRVTTVCGCLDKPALVMWAANSAIDYVHEVWSNGKLNEQELQIAKSAWRKQSSKGLNIGKDVHNLIEQHIKDGLDISMLPGNPAPEVVRAIKAFLEFEEEHIAYWLMSECCVWSDKMETAGTLDALAVMKKPYKGAVYIIDFKTSSGIFDEAYFQVGGYYLTWLELIDKDLIPPHLHPDGTLILRLDKKTGMPQWKDSTEFLPQSAETFRRLALMMQAKIEFDQVKPDWRDK